MLPKTTTYVKNYDNCTENRISPVLKYHGKLKKTK